LQLPLNLIESAASAPGAVIERASQADLAVLTNRPLNAIVGEGLLRLVDPPAIPDMRPSIAADLDAVATAEAEFREIFAPELRSPDGGPAPRDLLAWGSRLDVVAERDVSLEQWSDIEHQVVRPQTRRVLDALDAATQGELRARWLTWRATYVPALESLLRSLRHRAAEHSAHCLAPLRAALSAALPERAAEPLSRLATWTAASVPGVTSVLVGMRHKAYVADLQQVLRWAPETDPERVFSLVRAARSDD
jgi:hypothetical protein